MKKPPPNNYFHVRVYTNDGSKIELYRDKKYPNTRREIIDGLRWAIEIIEKLDAVPADAAIDLSDKRVVSVPNDVTPSQRAEGSS